MGKPYIVAIAGGTCSGKSTLAQKITQGLSGYQTKHINMDAYYKKEVPTVTAPFTNKRYPEHNHPDALELDAFYRDFEACKAQNLDIILVEGIFALYLKKIREQADLKLFVDLESDERMARRIKRFREKGDSEEEIVSRYLDTVRFRHAELVEPTRWYADIVVNGCFAYNRSVQIVTDYIKTQIKGENEK